MAWIILRGFIGIIAFSFIIPLWGLLYLPAAAVATAIHFALITFFPAGSYIVALVAIWPLGRIEQRLAQYRAYRGIRHGLRLAFCGGLGILAGQQSPWLGIPLAVLFMGAAHVALVKAGPLRGYWHAYLRSIGLRPASLPA